MTKKTSHSPTYHIGTVAKLTGVSTHTIRVWERRYNAVEPGRSPGGTREYGDSDVTKLGLLKALTDGGHSIGQIAHLDIDELHAMSDQSRQRGTGGAAVGPESAALGGFMRALERLDLDAAERALSEAARTIGPLGVVFDVIAPIITEIGDRWANGDLRIAHEHAATAVLRNFLGSFLSSNVTRADAPVAAATTLSGELHEMGAIMSAFVATTRGWRTVYLGPNMPVGEIAHVVETTSASLLLLSIVNPRDDETASRLRDLMSVLPDNIRLFVGGRSAHAYADILPNGVLVASLLDLYEQLGPRATRPLRAAGDLDPVS